MKRISIANDIVPIGEFKAGISKWIKKSKSSGNPIVITQNGRSAAVVISPTDYDQLTELRQFVDSVKRGLTDQIKENYFVLAKFMQNWRKEDSRDQINETYLDERSPE